MRIGIIGSGNIGATAARLLTRAGHDVAVANSRGPESLAGLVRELGERARAETVEGAADFGEVVLVAIPLGRYRELPADRLRAKIVIDANNYYPGRDGNIEGLDADRITSTELIGRHLEGARMVKALNTMQSGTLATEGRPDAPPEERLVLFVAGDDGEAKRVVSELIEQMGFTAIDTGSLAEGGRRQQPGSPVYGRLMTRADVENPSRPTVSANLRTTS
jgi:predicted dinucleotide-binding enzyme